MRRGAAEFDTPHVPAQRRCPNLRISGPDRDNHVRNAEHVVPELDGILKEKTSFALAVDTFLAGLNSGIAGCPREHEDYTEPKGLFRIEPLVRLVEFAVERLKLRKCSFP